MELKRLTEYSNEIHQALTRLLIQLSPNRKEISKDALDAALKSPNTYLFGLFDNEKLIGTGTLIIMNTFPAQRGYLHDIVIDENYRGKGLANQIVNKIIDTAKELKLTDITLTSKEERGTRKFFEKFGFAIRETNFFQLNL